MAGDTRPGKCRRRAGNEGGRDAAPRRAAASCKVKFATRLGAALSQRSVAHVAGPGEGRVGHRKGAATDRAALRTPLAQPAGSWDPWKPKRTARAQRRRQGPGALTGLVGGRSGGRRFPG